MLAAMDPSPLAAHAASPAELRLRIEAERRGRPFLVVREDGAGQRIVELEGTRLSVGRATLNDVALPGDTEVSRLHAELECIGGEWTVSDDGLSRNGTWVNGERVAGRRRLRDGDVVQVGDTTLAFCAAPDTGGGAAMTVSTDGPPLGDVLTPAQRRVLLALCRPYRDSAFATPASNRAIAEELSLSVDAVKTTMRALFALFGIEDLPQNQKRAALALQALRSGAVARRDL
jgi:pSer/pThr/pTyr-binding forkhead associated (FHA) protein